MRRSVALNPFVDQRPRWSWGLGVLRLEKILDYTVKMRNITNWLILAGYYVNCVNQKDVMQAKKW